MGTCFFRNNYFKTMFVSQYLFDNFNILGHFLYTGFYAYSICKNNVSVTPKRGFHIFLKRTYQTKPRLVPTGLMMKYGRMLLK